MIFECRMVGALQHLDRACAERFAGLAVYYCLAKVFNDILRLLLKLWMIMNSYLNIIENIYFIWHKLYS